MFAIIFLPFENELKVDNSNTLLDICSDLNLVTKRQSSLHYANKAYAA